jgi:hypothetical protein
MQAIIGPTLLSRKMAQPTHKPFEIYDSRLSGFTLRVQPSGVRSYYARFGRNRRVALGQAGTIESDEARERCLRVLGNVAHGRHPLHGLGGMDGITLGMFIADRYTPWVQASRPRTAADTLEKLYRHFRRSPQIALGLGGFQPSASHRRGPKCQESPDPTCAAQ